jgi:hypothetical protein
MDASRTALKATLKLVRKRNQSEVAAMKARLGERLRAMRDKRKQEDVQMESGIDRGIISHIENGSTDYTIGSLVRVLLALKADETALLTDDTIEEAMKKKLVLVLRKGDPSDRDFLMRTIERAAAPFIGNSESIRVSVVPGPASGLRKGPK